jgi:hypothetical protein
MQVPKAIHHIIATNTPPSEKSLDIEVLMDAFKEEPLDYEAAWYDLKRLVERAGITSRMPTVRLYNYCAIRVISLRF